MYTTKDRSKAVFLCCAESMLARYEHGLTAQKVPKFKPVALHFLEPLNFSRSAGERPATKAACWCRRGLPHKIDGPITLRRILKFAADWQTLVGACVALLSWISSARKSPLRSQRSGT
jgi:hypothetical protein